MGKKPITQEYLTELLNLLKLLSLKKSFLREKMGKTK
jgi:hypothetical protein